MEYYEAHVTVNSDNKELVKKITTDHGWTFSAIDGDPILGEGVKCYATKHFNARKSQQEILLEMNTVALDMQISGIKVLRRKLERVVYDQRVSQ